MFYINTFLIFSILGFGYEKITSFLLHQPKDALLLGPWMPIYGIGLLVVHMINIILEKRSIHGARKVFWCFLISVVLLTILEEIGGLLTNFLFAKSFWSYEGIPLAIGPYINVFISFIWGVLAMFLEFVLFPVLIPFLKKIPRWLTIVILGLFLFDNLLALKNNLVLFQEKQSLFLLTLHFFGS